jgi:hypothetical protein
MTTNKQRVREIECERDFAEFTAETLQTMLKRAEARIECLEQLVRTHLGTIEGHDCKFLKG